MPSVEERLATLEGRVQEQAAYMADVRGNTAEAIRDLRREIALLFQQVDQRFQQVDQRFQQVDQRFQQIDQRFDRVDQRFDRIERQFMWVLGVMVTGFTGVIGALVANTLR